MCGILGKREHIPCQKSYNGFLTPLSFKVLLVSSSPLFSEVNLLHLMRDCQVLSQLVLRLTTHLVHISRTHFHIQNWLKRNCWSLLHPMKPHNWKEKWTRSLIPQNSEISSSITKQYSHALQSHCDLRTNYLMICMALGIPFINACISGPTWRFPGSFLWSSVVVITPSCCIFMGFPFPIYLDWSTCR